MKRLATLVLFIVITLSSALSPATSLADHYGCYFPAGTGDPAQGQNVPWEVQEQFRKAYCLYKNGTGVTKVDLGAPAGDATTSRVHDWGGVWNQNFQGPLGQTNLMYQRLDGRVYRNYGVWLDKLIARGGPGEMGAPINDPHEWWGGIIQDRRGGRAGDTAFMRRRDGQPVYAVHGGFWHKYLQKDGAGGFLGYPTSDQKQGRDSVITGARTLYMTFEGGVLQYHVGGPRNGQMFEVHGAIRAKWEQLGVGESGLGLPVSDEYIWNGKPRSDFENGYMTWNGQQAEPSYTTSVILNPGSGAVDGRQIRYKNHTKYVNAVGFAVAQWGSLGRVAITATTDDNVTLEWREVRDCDPKAAPGWFNRPVGSPFLPGYLPATIYLNTCKLDNYSDFDRRKVATHELGHALGLDHHIFSRQVMCYSTGCIGSVNTPQALDKNIYYLLYP